MNSEIGTVVERASCPVTLELFYKYGILNDFDTIHVQGEVAKMLVVGRLHGWIFKEWPAPYPKKLIIVQHEESKADITKRPAWFAELRKNNLGLIGQDILDDEKPENGWNVIIIGEPALELLIREIKKQHGH